MVCYSTSFLNAHTLIWFRPGTMYFIRFLDLVDIQATNLFVIIIHTKTFALRSVLQNQVSFVSLLFSILIDTE